MITSPGSKRRIAALTSCNQFGQGAWKAAFTLRKAVPAGAVIRRNSGDARLLEMDDAHSFLSVPCGHVRQCH